MALEITWADVAAVATDLATLSSTTQNAILAQVPFQVSRAQWGDLTPSGQAYLAAHLGALSKRGLNGPVASQTVGPVTRTFMQFALSKGSLGTTPWGLEYLRISALLPAVFGSVVC